MTTATALPLGVTVLFVGDGAPTAADDEDLHGARPGYLWHYVDAGSPRWWLCRSSAVGAAVWDEVAMAAAVATLTASLASLSDTVTAHIGAGGSAHAAAVASGAAGFMTGADKAKLDGIAAGAQPGTVTSVGLSAPAIFTLSGSPVTVSGTLSLTLATQVANRVWAGPATGADAAPAFRVLVADDIPALPWSKITSGANDLNALEGLSTTGIAVRISADTWALRSVAAGANAGIAVTNADGVAGNPTISLTGVALSLHSNANGPGHDALELPRATEFGDLAFTSAAALRPPPRVQNSAYTILPSDHERLLIANSGTPTFTLLAGTEYPPGFRFRVWARVTSVTIARSGADTINGGTSVSVTDGSRREVHLVTNSTFEATT